MIKNTDKFKGRIIHSRMYRNPEEFKDKNVCVLGSAASGEDISTEIATSCKKCYVVGSVHMDPNGKSPYGPNQNIYRVYGTIDEVNENGVHVAADK